MVQKFKKYIPALLLIVIPLVVWLCGIGQYLSLEQAMEHRAVIEGFIGDHYVLALAIYCCLFIAAAASSIPIVTVFSMAGGFFFGRMIGIVCTVFSATIGAIFFFLSAKMATQDMLSSSKYRKIEQLREGFQRRPFTYIFCMRLIPLLPFAGINFAAAVFQVPTMIFCLATLLGSIPGAFVYTSFGIALKEAVDHVNVYALFDTMTIVVLALFAVLLVVPVIYKLIKKR